MLIMYVSMLNFCLTFVLQEGTGVKMDMSDIRSLTLVVDLKSLRTLSPFDWKYCLMLTF